MVSKKIYILLLFLTFRLNRTDLDQWLILSSETPHGAARFDDFRDKSKEQKRAAKKIGVKTLKKLFGDAYYASMEEDIERLEELVGQAIQDIFDDNPVFAEFRHLSKLARNRDFEIMYYGKIR